MNKYLTYISIFILVLNLVLLILKFKSEYSIRLLITFLFVSLFTQIGAAVLSISKINNLFLLHTYTLVEVILLSLIYRSQLTRSSKNRRHYRNIIILLSTLVVANSLWLEPLTSFNNNAKTLTHIAIIAQAVAYLFSSAETERHRLTSLFNFFNAAVLVYYAGSFFIFMFSDFLAQNSVTIHRIFLAVNAMLYLVFQILILLGVWTYLKQRKKFI